ncbi:hypothetical protein LC653_41325, partial [Nostoc sp. CHAB 5784]|uniref:hypothetical protein n=1 Tax=Nostoc mirabile TaxID=2907820 RepID=UPI001E4013FE
NNPVRSLTMNQEKQERIKACLQELSTLLYEEADKSKLTDLEGNDVKSTRMMAKFSNFDCESI